jgi:hypothetical protein
MSKDIDFIDLTTVVPAETLDDIQELATGAAWGIKMSVSAGTTVNVQGDPLTEGQFSARVGAKPRYGTSTISVVGSGGSGARDIFLTSANVTTPKAPTIEMDVPPATPATAFYRKIGEATWSGSAITNLRLTNGVQANADQVNNFIFTPFLTSSTPLTVRGLASQSADIFRVEDSTATAILRVTATAVIFGAVTATGAVTHPAGTQAAPSITFSGDTSTGIFSPGTGRVAISATNTNNFEVATTPAIVIGTSTASTPIILGGDVQLSRGAANRLDLATGDTLNLVNGAGSLLFNGVALASTHLSDSGTLVRTTGATFTGAVQIPAGTALAPSFTFTGATTSGMYSPSANVLGLAAGGVSMATLASTGIVNLPQAASSSTYLQLGSGVRMYSGAGTGVTATGTDILTIMGQSLEVRKSDGASQLILSRPDGTRVAISLDNTNAFVITPL